MGDKWGKNRDQWLFPKCLGQQHFGLSSAASRHCTEAFICAHTHTHTHSPVAFPVLILLLFPVILVRDSVSSRLPDYPIANKLPVPPGNCGF